MAPGGRRDQVVVGLLEALVIQGNPNRDETLARQDPDRAQAVLETTEIDAAARSGLRDRIAEVRALVDYLRNAR